MDQQRSGVQEKSFFCTHAIKATNTRLSTTTKAFTPASTVLACKTVSNTHRVLLSRWNKVFTQRLR